MKFTELPTELRDMILDEYVGIGGYWRGEFNRSIKELSKPNKQRERMIYLRYEILGHRARRSLEERGAIQYGLWWPRFIESQVHFYGERLMVEMYGLH